jgi:hypothetical protein
MTLTMLPEILIPQLYPAVQNLTSYSPKGVLLIWSQLTHHITIPADTLSRPKYKFWNFFKCLDGPLFVLPIAVEIQQHLPIDSCLFFFLISSISRHFLRFAVKHDMEFIHTYLYLRWHYVVLVWGQHTLSQLLLVCDI